MHFIVLRFYYGAISDFGEDTSLKKKKKSAKDALFPAVCRHTRFISDYRIQRFVVLCLLLLCSKSFKYGSINSTPLQSSPYLYFFNLHFVNTCMTFLSINTNRVDIRAMRLPNIVSIIPFLYSASERKRYFTISEILSSHLNTHSGIFGHLAVSFLVL